MFSTWYDSLIVPVMDLNSYTWLITILVVPASAFAVGWFTNTQQNRRAEEIEKYLDKRMESLDKRLTEVKADLTSDISNLNTTFKGDLNAAAGRIEKGMTEMESRIKEMLRLEIRMALAEQNAQNTPRAASSSR